MIFSLYLALFSFILFFPQFGIDKTDTTGFVGAEFYSNTHLLHGVWLLLLILITIYGFLRNIELLKYISRCGYFVTTILITTACSIAFNTPDSLPAWIRFAQWGFNVTACLLLLNYLIVVLKYSERMIELHFYTYIVISFLCILPILLFYLITDREMVLWEAFDRGTRFGGYVIHSNSLGLGAVISIIASVSLYIYRRISLYLCILFCSIALVVLALTKSLDSIISLIVILALITIKFSFSNSVFYKISIYLMFICMTSAFILFPLAPFIVDDAHTPASLKDRFVIYESTVPHLSETGPWGYGFYKGEILFLNSVMNQEAHWSPRHPHNLLLDILLSRGYVGGCIIIYFVVIVIYNCMKILLEPKYTARTGIAYVIFCIMISNLVEESFVGDVRAYCTTQFFFAAFLVLKLNTKSVSDNSADHPKLLA